MENSRRAEEFRPDFIGGRTMELMKLLETRRTYRKYDGKREIPAEVLQDMKDSLRMASSAANLQPLRYIFISDRKTGDELFSLLKWAARLPEDQGKPGEGERPPLYVVVWYDAEDRNRWTDIDAGLAISNITLAAWNHGVGSCIFGSADENKVRELLGMGDNCVINSVISFGYPVHESEIVDMKDGDVAYYLDEKGNFRVPKRSESEIITEK